VLSTIAGVPKKVFEILFRAIISSFSLGLIMNTVPRSAAMMIRSPTVIGVAYYSPPPRCS